MIQALWMGPDAAEARAAFGRAREAGLSGLRALVIGQVASFRDCFAFRKTLADRVGCSIRTVQRALTQAVAEGLIGKARAKKDERTPDGKVMPCGWSHRWIVGRGKAGAAVREAVQAAKARWIVKRSLAPPPQATAAPIVPTRPNPSQPRPVRRWTAADLDAELERLAREKPPPEPDG